MNRIIWIPIVALACGGEGNIGGGGDGSAWWNVPTNDVWTDGNVDPEGEGEEDDEEEGFEGPEQFFWGELQVGNDGPTGGGEIGLYVVDANGVRCDWFSEVSSVGAASVACPDCTWSGSVQLSGFEKEADDPSCASFGIDENAVEIGYSGESSYWLRNGAWEAAGYSEIEGSAWFFEIPLGEEE